MRVLRALPDGLRFHLWALFSLVLNECIPTKFLSSMSNLYNIINRQFKLGRFFYPHSRIISIFKHFFLSLQAQNPLWQRATTFWKSQEVYWMYAQHISKKKKVEYLTQLTEVYKCFNLVVPIILVDRII